MKRIAACAFILISQLLAGRTTQKPDVQIVSPMPYGDEGMGYEISRPGFIYREHFDSLDKIDSKNFVIHWFQRKRHVVCGQLRGGYWESHDGVELNSLRLVKSYSLPSSEPGSDFLLVLFEYYGVSGSSDSSGIAQVWKLRDGRLSVEQQIDYNTHFRGVGANETHFRKDDHLLVRASHYLTGDAHCCVSAYDELTLRWSGSEYVLTRIETKRVPAISDENPSKKN